MALGPLCTHAVDRRGAVRGAPYNFAMNRYGYGDDWADGFTSWAEVTELLREEWTRVEQVGWDLCLERVDAGLFLPEPAGRWHARHRRALHRLGFRPLRSGRAAVWHWAVKQQLESIDLAAFATPMESAFAAARPERAAVYVQQLRTVLATEHLIREQTQRVLRDAFRCEPGEVAVLLAREEDEWEEDQDDDLWSLPSG